MTDLAYTIMLIGVFVGLLLVLRAVSHFSTSEPVQARSPRTPRS